MKSSWSLVGVIAALAWGCDGFDGTVGVETKDSGVEPDAGTNLCDATACADAGGDAAGETGSDAASETGSDAASEAGGDAGSVHYVLVTPEAEPLGETSVQLTWAAPAGAPVAWYDVRASSDPASTPGPTALTHLPAGSTRATLSGLKPGTLGRVVVAAAVGDAPGADAPSAPMWTPYGAVNEDTVSSVTPLAGYAGIPYAEGMFVSATFSMFFAHGYVKEASFVFAGVPGSGTARPIYNFASPVIRYPNGFAYPDVTDITQIWSDGVSKVLLANSNQNRILVYNHLPLSPDTAAPDLILGQTTWTGTDPNGGAASVNSAGFRQAAGACFDGTTLYVRDNANNRILGWRGWPTQMGQPADFVLGQPDMTTSTANTGGISKGTLSFGINGGVSIECHRGRLAVADTGNHRVLIWNTAPRGGGVAADVILGQSAASAQAPSGAGGLAAGGMMTPQDVVLLDGGTGRTAVVVSDSDANRLTAWNDIPATDGAPFDRVYGQADRSSTAANAGGRSMASLSTPLTLTVDHENRFWVADFSNGRALRFTLESPTAIGIFGQRSGDSSELFPGSFSATRYAWAHFNKGLFYIDPSSGLFSVSSFRTMFWNTAPTDGNVPVSAVQGQVDDATVPASAPPVSATSVNGAGALAMAGGRVYWSDTGRILSKVGTFTANNSVPDVVLGNQDFGGKVVGPTTLDYAIAPTFLATDGVRLLAVDGARIVGWNAAPTTSRVPIDFAVGQPAVTENTPNNGGVSARSLGGGRNGMTVVGGKLIVADSANHRVLVWNAIPSASGVPADVVLGQPDFASHAAGAGLAQMNAPSGVAVLGGNLVVSDTGNGRLLVFQGIPASGAAASRAWDPRATRFSLPAWYDGEQLKPQDVGAFGGRLYVGQTGRVLVLPDFFSL